MTFVIAIDGPASSGKSTVGAMVAGRLSTEHLDTGAMYRAVAWAAVEAGVRPSDGAALGELAGRLRIEVGDRVTVDGRDVTEAIRAPEVSAVVSEVAAHPPVREVLVREQRAWAAAREQCVVEGRDIGSVVFPDAKVKVYLTAAATERAARRARELDISSPEEVAALAGQIKRRDELDAARPVSPLKVAEGAHVIDSTGRAVESVVEEIMELL